MSRVISKFLPTQFKFLRFYPAQSRGGLFAFSLMKNQTKNQERTMLPPLRDPYSFKMNFFFFEIWKSTKMNVKGLGMFIHQRLRTGLWKPVLWQLLNLPPCPCLPAGNAAKKVHIGSCNGMTPKILLIISLFFYTSRLQPPLITFHPHWLVRQLQVRPKHNPSKHQAQRRRLFAVGLLFFKVLMVSSFLLGMVPFPLKEKD